MARSPDLPRTIPLFPLGGAILLPRSRLPLQIFEPRYLQMVEDVLATPERLIGMIQPMQNGKGRLSQIGCAGRIVAFSELPDRRMMISLQARSRFRVLHQEPEGERPYRVALVDWQDFRQDLDSRGESAPGYDRATLMTRLRRFADLRGLASDWSAAESAEEETLVNMLSMLLPFSHEEKQALLESPTLADRRELLDGLLEYALRGGEDEERIQ
ncbi:MULTISPECIES: LON peptidase substrate-binding domain-containing protein [Paracoccus]|jgi:Lon protease-like protein|uniref:ATP-dependent protease n=1 Tax=Paracoccus litorisediminis TaxID=2006130 RepID=A0A844HIW7_9RHOB|nr:MULTISPECIES: LON peptidase substrate-binding domain-containing protein [Paracoccus]MBD9526569.1 LON peptidase substrate-binding domain-containing protein [Paracoccus sp. PAR01]MTH58969.1 ATP-dependent protease [Paracoccus litorisediminis]